MKKLKIFLMIGILLLCFGFALSSEVHAQGGGPKLFEIGDVLPATTQLKISWDGIEAYIWSSGNYITTNGKTIVSSLTYNPPDGDIKVNNVLVWSNGSYIPPYTNSSGEHNYIIIDTSEWTEPQRTVNKADLASDVFWEDLNAPSAKPFEIGDILPAGNIKISWDFTDKPLADDITFDISTSGGLYIEINKFGSIQLGIYVTPISYETFYADIPGETVITLPEPCTVVDIDGTVDYETYIGDALMWEVVSPEYAEGFLDARQYFGFSITGQWYTGGQVRELYGYYDPITERWLSVDEYLDLYGTGNGSTGASDFYNNFDKYFIPAMILVFGAAIVLTVLKVFKGRE